MSKEHTVCSVEPKYKYYAQKWFKFKKKKKEQN